MQKWLLDIVGPTASGKTATAIHLAKSYDAEIISCDSRQFYKEMNIGTAVPSLEELASASHHFIQHISIKDTYSVGHFEKDAIQMLNSFYQEKDIAILVGGSMLYEKAICEGLDFFPEVDLEVKKSVAQLFEDKGIEGLQKLVKEKDPIYFTQVDLKNPMRLIRALEVSLSSGKPYSYFLGVLKPKRDFKTLKIGMLWERSELYDRINKRVDLMVENGLLKEAEQLFEYRHLNALNTVGYKELFAYFDGQITLEFTIEEIKKNTRRFAKRQLTWYRKDTDIQWFNPKDVHLIQNYVKTQIESFE